MSFSIYVSHGRLDGGNTRTDFDAVGSLAMFWRSAVIKGWRRGVNFDVDLVDYYADALEPLKRFYNADVYVADIPPDAVGRPEVPGSIRKLERTLRQLRDRGVRIHFIDHHPVTWQTRQRFEWYRRENLLAGLDICRMDMAEDRMKPLEEKRCATEMVRDYLAREYGVVPDDVMRSIGAFAHDQDFGIRETPDATRLSVIIGSDYDPLILAEMMANGHFWSDELEGRYNAHQAHVRWLLGKLVIEKRPWRLGSGRVIDVVYALMPHEELKVTVAGMHCIRELGGTAAVLVQRKPFLSMRISAHEHELHAGEILAPLGGGGHVGAASAGGRGGTLPYQSADEGFFCNVVDRLNSILLRNSGATAA